MAFPDEWGYYKEYEQPGSADGELTNYQVAITVTHITDKMRSDFGDIRFTLEDLTELSYHLVSYTESDEALFVVKIPTIPAAGVTIRCYYGNSTATTTSDPDNTYDLYHSLGDQSGFTVVTGSWSNENGYLYETSSIYSRIKHNFTDTGQAFKYEFKLRGPTPGNYPWAGLEIKSPATNYNNNDQGYLVLIYTNGTNGNIIKIFRATNGNLTELANQSYNFNNNIWYDIKVTIDQNGLIQVYVNDQLTTNATDTTYTMGSVIRLFNTNTANLRHDFDELRISKHTTNPPINGTFGSEIQSLVVGNAVASGLPLVMYNVPTGEAVASGLPVIFTNWELINIGNAVASGLEIEKWFAYTPSFFIENEDGIILKDLSFESLFAGKKSDMQKLTAINNLETEMNMTLRPSESFNQVGDGLDTYLSQYLSLDDVNFSNQPLLLTIPAHGELDFYTYWQPSSTARIGWKEWLLDLDLEGVPSLEGWGYVSWFPVTGTGVAIEIPYTLEEPVGVDYVHGLMEYDFKDIRFAFEDHTILKHSIITKTDGDHAYFFVQLPEIPATTEDIVIYVYSGNKDAEDESDPTIVPIMDNFLGTSLKSYKWEVSTLSYSVNNNLSLSYGDFGVTGYVRYKLPVPSSFDIETKITQANRNDNKTALALFKEDNTPIVKIGIWTDTSTTGRNYAETESVWFNIAPGWTDGGNGFIYGSQVTWLNGGRYRMVRNGSTISVYANDVHIADTIINSEVNSLGIFSEVPALGYSATIDYIGESDLVDITPPTTGEVEPVWINIYPLPVKADILYSPVDLPGLGVERRYGIRIGGTHFE